MRLALVSTATLLGVALVLQIAYARNYSAQATRATKVVWGLNMALLVLVIVGLVVYAFTVEGV